MLNGIFVAIVLISILLAGFSGRIDLLTTGITSDATKAVDLAIRLVGTMALFLGLMRVAEKAGLLYTIARALGPVFRRLFPSVPDGHPAISVMILNISSTMLGLGNAATPFGIKAMEELNKLNRRQGTATDAMVLFLAINTAGFALLPSTVIAVRASVGSTDPAGIFLTTWVASGCATVVGVLAAKLLGRLPRYRATAPPTGATGDEPPDDTELESPEREETGAPRFGRPLTALFWIAFLALLVRYVWTGSRTDSALDLFRGVFSYWLLPALIGGVVLFGWARGVKVYEALVEGAKEGFQVALRIIPYLVAILVAVGMLRASGGIDLLRIIGPLTSALGMPAEVLPLALLRPLSGSGSMGLMTEIMTAHGPDTTIGYMVSTVWGSTETTFYILAVYFGAVGVKATRHTLPACLLADAGGILAGVYIVNLIFG